VGDVGQDLWEEINSCQKGSNYGWRIMEAHHAYDYPLAGTLGHRRAALGYPIHEYGHGPLGIAAIGGFVYRGTNYPALVGCYVFGDYSTGFGSPDGHPLLPAANAHKHLGAFCLRPGPQQRAARPVVKGFGRVRPEYLRAELRHGGPPGCRRHSLAQ